MAVLSFHHYFSLAGQGQRYDPGRKFVNIIRFHPLSVGPKAGIFPYREPVFPEKIF
jgi:hypothetical protein